MLQLTPHRVRRDTEKTGVTSLSRVIVYNKGRITITICKVKALYQCGGKLENVEWGMKRLNVNTQGIHEARWNK